MPNKIQLIYYRLGMEGQASIPRSQQTNVYKTYNQARELQLANQDDAARNLYEQLNVPQTPVAVRSASLHNLGVLEHADSRKQFAEAVKLTQRGELDKALKSLEAADKKLTGAEEFYVSVFKLPAAGNSVEVSATAQQNLLEDRSEIEKFRKQIEDLKN